MMSPRSVSALFATTIRDAWFTADWHLGHRNIINYRHRPYETVEEMDADLIAKHNALVEPDDLVWMCGDMILGGIEAGLEKMQDVNGRKILVAGNHDMPFAGNKLSTRRRDEWEQRYRDAGFVTVVTGSAMLRRNGRPVQIAVGASRSPVLISHFPYEGDTQGEDRYAAYRPKRPRTGETPWLVCGHVHDAWQIRDRMINVGVDAWNYVPVPMEIITEFVENGDQA